MIKAVFFDFDETLQDRTAAFERYMDGFFARFFPGVTGGELEEKKHQMRQSGNGGYVDRVEWYKGLIALWHWTDAPAAEALAEHYDRTFGDCCVIFPDAVPMLQALRKKGIVTGVITNGPSYLQNHKMDESGLRPYLDLVIVSGDVGVHKPDPALFLYSYVRKEAVLSSQIEGTQSTLDELLLFENEGVPGVPVEAPHPP